MPTARAFHRPIQSGLGLRWHFGLHRRQHCLLALGESSQSRQHLRPIIAQPLRRGQGRICLVTHLSERALVELATLLQDRLHFRQPSLRKADVQPGAARLRESQTRLHPLSRPLDRIERITRQASRGC
ncbi:MAG: hypothetical protein DRI80_18255 [Chloroflexota bacterium]|nr:MAG: hypothetical protein DRI80_18255 [Chloroflexota bacterium]